MLFTFHSHHVDIIRYASQYDQHALFVSLSRVLSFAILRTEQIHQCGADAIHSGGQRRNTEHKWRQMDSIEVSCFRLQH